ncbi:MAG TPA: DNA-processing protein DprA [Candidatus Paceibacterota bacterium]|nr:DNA-processing protein DprA [Candidatus Paceibacterota bacterium]
MIETETRYYHSLNLLLGSDYRAIARVKRGFGTWEAAWRGQGGGAEPPAADWDSVGRTGLRLILRESEDYPPLLRETFESPFGIYIKGALPAPAALALAIVGTRKATPEGRGLAGKFAKEIAGAGFIIVSGLAFGIDAAAHAGCLEANGALRDPNVAGPGENGTTIAVLAHGLDDFYPKSNRYLGEQIIARGGAVISEYPPGMPALPHRFLERNRIIAGLAQGTLVIEAPERSGSLATARFALEENRDVFVIPGPILHPNYKGSNQLIRQGAALVTDPREILEAYGMGEKETARREASLASPEEKLILSALRSIARPADIDKLIEMTRLEPRVANQAVAFLLLKHLIEENERGYTIT